jgi:hypothetical protein
VLQSSDSSCILFYREEFRKLFGRDFDKNTDVVLAMNGDGRGIPVHVEGCTYLEDSGVIYATFDRHWSNAIRVNYMVVLA